MRQVVDKHLKNSDFESRGELANDAIQIMMKDFYGARFVRYDCRWPIGNLPKRVGDANEFFETRSRSLQRPAETQRSPANRNLPWQNLAAATL